MHYFISDLHLSETEPALSSLFFDFLAEHAPRMSTLHIVGDCFDAYVGDDDDSELLSGFATALQQLSAAGTSVYLQHGNRDFLIGEAFAKRCGAQLLGEFVELRLGERVLQLCHGDQFCTDDASYQAFRAHVRSSAWQTHFLSQPFAARRAFAAQARAQSQAHQQGQSYSEISDVSAVAINAHFQTTAATALLHGHTHRPDVHAIRVGDHARQRIVLGDWRVAQASWLCMAPNGTFELHAHGKTWQGQLA